MLDLTQVRTCNSTRKMWSMFKHNHDMIYVIQNRQRFVEFLSARSLEFIFFRSDIVASTRELHEVNVLRNHNYDHVITTVWSWQRLILGEAVPRGQTVCGFRLNIVWKYGNFIKFLNALSLQFLCFVCLFVFFAGVAEIIKNKVYSKSIPFLLARVACSHRTYKHLLWRLHSLVSNHYAHLIL